MAKGDPPFSITRSIKWLSDAANSSEVKSGKGARILAFQAYKFVLGMTPSPWMPPDLMDGAILSQIESTTDPDLLRQLEVLLLGSRQSTLKLLKRYPALRQMDINDVTIRMVTLKSLFPGSNVARMMELTPSAFLAAPWLETEKRLEKSSKLLREKLQGADLDFMFQVTLIRGLSYTPWIDLFDYNCCLKTPKTLNLKPVIFPQEDPTILFEDIESLKIGLERLKDLWDVDEQAMANSEPLELALAVKALGLSGPPKKF